MAPGISASFNIFFLPISYTGVFLHINSMSSPSPAIVCMIGALRHIVFGHMRIAIVSKNFSGSKGVAVQSQSG
jgi:hypothetical protein